MKKQLAVILAVFGIVTLTMNSLHAQQKQNSTQSSGSVFFVERAKVFENYNLAQDTKTKINQSKQELEAKKKPKIEEVNKLKQEYNDIVKKGELAKGEDSPMKTKALDNTEKELASRAKKIDELSRDYNDLFFKLDQEFQEKVQKLAGAREDEVDAEIKKLGKQMNAPILYAEAAGYFPDSVNVTDQIIANLNKAHPATKK